MSDITIEMKITARITPPVTPMTAADGRTSPAHILVRVNEDKIFLLTDNSFFKSSTRRMSWAEVKFAILELPTNPHEQPQLGGSTVEYGILFVVVVVVVAAIAVVIVAVVKGNVVV